MTFLLHLWQALRAIVALCRNPTGKGDPLPPREPWTPLTPMFAEREAWSAQRAILARMVPGIPPCLTTWPELTPRRKVGPS